jgi:hypothetical protein
MVTEAAARYFDSAFSTFGLFHFLIEMTLRADYVAHTARRALDGEALDKDLTPSELAATSPGPATMALRAHRQALLQMVLAREVDNFTTYISETIRAAIRARPGLVRSRQDVRLDYVLSFPSMEALTEDLIDRKVSDLGYMGLSELDTWLKQHTGLTLFTDATVAGRIGEAVETRNAIVHAGGAIGRKYLKNVSNSQFGMGEVRKLNVDDLFEVWEALFNTVRALDAEAAKKFGLPQTKRAQPGMGVV